MKSFDSLRFICPVFQLHHSSHRPYTFITQAFLYCHIHALKLTFSTPFPSFTGLSLREENTSPEIIRAKLILTVFLHGKYAMERTILTLLEMEEVVKQLHITRGRWIREAKIRCGCDRGRSRWRCTTWMKVLYCRTRCIKLQVARMREAGHEFPWQGITAMIERGYAERKD